VSSETVVTSDTPEAHAAWPPDLARNITIGLAVFLSILAAIRYGIHAETLVMIFFICVLVVISRVDLERRIIPNRIVVPAWIAVLLAQLAIQPHRWLEWIVASFGAGLFFLVVALVYPGGLGMGDVKLALLMGAALGWAVTAALLLGTLAAGVAAAIMLFKEGSSARKRAIPLGPFLAGAAIVVVLFL
jgi:leader peptidase (prepilin peptidase)/N-methyltransferase